MVETGLLFFLAKPSNYNDLLFNVRLMCTSHWSSLQHDRRDRMSSTLQRQNSADSVLFFCGAGGQVLTRTKAAVQSDNFVHWLTSKFGLGSNVPGQLNGGSKHHIRQRSFLSSRVCNNILYAYTENLLSKHC